MSGRELWPHQERAISLTRASFKAGHTMPLVVMPTGAGKTFTASYMAGGCVERGNTVLWFAHREELVEQAYDALTAAGLSCGVIMSKPTRPVNPHRPVLVASTQTLLARKIFPDVKFIIADEAHHYASDQWGELLAEYRRRKVLGLGLTATPVRADGRALDVGYDDLIVPVRMKELVAAGVLVPCRIIGPKRALRSDEIAALPVDAYKAHGEGRKTIVFANNVKSAAEFRDQFNAAGIPAGLVTGEQDVGERRATLEAYKAGRLQVLCNVGVLTEGFDDPATSCVILARSLGSLSLYLQITGRALRSAPAVGKKDAILIDLHGSSRAFGPPDEDREYSLEGDGIVRKNTERAPERFCPGCGVLLIGDAYICGGEECAQMQRQGLLVPTVVKTELVRYEAKLRESPEQRKAYFEKLKQIAREKGYDKWQPIMKYKALYGERPPKNW